MKFNSCVASALVLAAYNVQGLPSLPHTHVSHETRDALSSHEWVKRSRLEEHQTLPVRIGLYQQNIENNYGHDLLMKISDPHSPSYGQHLSAEEIIDLFAPSQDTIDMVRSWLESSGIKRPSITLSGNRQWLQFDAKASELEALLYTTYHEYENTYDGVKSIACDRYHLPKEISPHVDFIKPGVALYSGSAPRSKKRHETRGDGRDPDDEDHGFRFKPITKPFPVTPEKLKAMPEGKACDIAVTPNCIRKLYNITDEISRVPGNSVGIYESEGEFYSQKSLNDFFATFATEIPQGTRPIYHRIDGAPPATTKTYDRGEANLDVQAVYPLVHPDGVVNFQVEDYHYEERDFPKGLFNTLLDAIDGSYCNYTAFGITGDSPGIDAQYPDKHKHGYMHKEQCGVFKPTNVISFSYGEGENQLPVNYQRRQCNEFMKLGLQGVTLVFASGDSGVETGRCKKGVFGPGTPVNCPYVTAVGSTEIPPGAEIEGGVEIATRDFPGGGGFSNIFPRPSYQDAAVKKYFEEDDPTYKFYKTMYERQPSNPNGGRYNRIGRSYPDVSAIGQNLAGYDVGEATLFAGTSVSAPLFAGIIARINNNRLAAGKSPVGFINPTLYAHPHMFNDVVSGNNPACGTKGFTCSSGWDPVTGLGTPNYGKMLEVFMAIP